MNIVHCRGFRARSLEFSRQTGFARHGHRGGHLVLVYEGEWIDQAGPRRRTLRREELLFQPGPVRHETHAAAGTKVTIVDLSHAALRAFCVLSGKRPHSLHTTFADAAGIPERIHAELSRVDEAATLVVHSLVLQLLAAGSRLAAAPSQRKPAWLPRLLAHIHENLGQRLTIGLLAEVAGVSESHLSHSFARYFDCSVSEYIRDCRLRAAARVLRRTQDSIQQIAWHLGFSDQAHFTRTFKAAYGATPTEYRSARTAWDELLWMERAGEER
jgi:AraC family transcriptional regulator